MKAINYFGKFIESQDADGFSVWLFGAIIIVIFIVLIIVIPSFANAMDIFVSKLPLKLHFKPP